MAAKYKEGLRDFNPQYNGIATKVPKVPGAQVDIPAPKPEAIQYSRRELLKMNGFVLMKSVDTPQVTELSPFPLYIGAALIVVLLSQYDAMSPHCFASLPQDSAPFPVAW